MRKVRYSIVCLVALFGTSAQAMLYSDTYDLVDASSTHGIWFNSEINVNGNLDRTFNLTKGTFAVNGNSATLSGETWSDILGGGFDFSVDMTYRCSGKYNEGCDGIMNPQPLGQVSASAIENNIWDFWDYVDNDTNDNYDFGRYDLMGTGNLDGVLFQITQKPLDGTKPFRFGLGADWFNDSLLGGSGWFKVIYKGDPDQDECRYRNDNDIYINYCNVYRGDFNVSVPEPSIIALFAAGLIGLGFARRRMRS